MISALGAGKDNPAFVHDDEAKPGQQSTKPGPGKPESGEQVVETGIGQQQQVVVKEEGKKAQEEDHEFDVEGKSVVSGKKRTGWM